MNTQALSLLLAGPLLGLPAAAEALYSRPHDLMVEAITAGSASGVLTGDVDEHFTREFRSTGSLFVTARVIAALDQAGCKQLELVFTKKDVATARGHADAMLKTRVNYCLDGRPPSEPGQS